MAQELDPVLDPARLAAVAASGLLDTPPDEAVDDLARLAARLLGAPLGFVTVVDDRRSFWKAAIGVPSEPRENTVAESFCQYVVRRPGTLMVEDAMNHPLTRDNPSVDGMGVRAWAGTTLFDQAGVALGSFCVVDVQPRAWSAADELTLETLSRAASAQLALRGALEAQSVARQEALALAGRLETQRGVLEEVVSRAPVGIAVLWGRDLEYRVMNEAALETVPDRGPVLGRRLLDVFPEAADVVASSILPIFETREAVTSTDVPITFDAPEGAGGERFYDVTYAPLFEAGEVAGVLCAFSETTDRVRRGRRLERDLEREIDTTRVLQEALLPDELAAVPGMRIAARYRPAASRWKVGGDFFDVFAVPDGHLAMVGDVCGKGPEAAASTALARWTVRSLAHTGAGVVDLASHLHAVWHSDIKRRASDAYLTVVLAHLRAAGDGAVDVEVLVAGHPPPVVGQPDRPAVEVGVPGPPIGIVDVPARHVARTRLEPGSRLVLYSDGLLDAQAPAEQLAPADVAAVLTDHRQLSTGAFADHLVDRATRGGPPRDDIAVVVLDVEP